MTAFPQIVFLLWVHGSFRSYSTIAPHLTSHLCCAPRLYRLVIQLSHLLYCLTISGLLRFPRQKTLSRSQARLPPALSLRVLPPRTFPRTQKHQPASCRCRHSGSKSIRRQTVVWDLQNHDQSCFSQWAQRPRQTSSVAAWSGILGSQAPHRIWLCIGPGASERASILWAWLLSSWTPLTHRAVHLLCSYRLSSRMCRLHILIFDSPWLAL